jgi:hypothetical protein
MINDARFDSTERRQIAVAVVIATLSAVASGFVQWGIETVKARAKRGDGKETTDDRA